MTSDTPEEPLTVNGYTPEQWMVWCRQVIAHTAIDLARRQRRWDRDGLGATTDVADAELLLLDGGAAQALDQVEWQLLFDQVLDGTETCVVDQLYWHAATQRQTAQICAISQTSLRRVHQQALRKLRRALW